jgi:hypothetical protein
VAGFASLDELKAHLNITRTSNDDELLLMLDAATDMVRSMVGSFDAGAVTERVAARGGTVVLSRRPPANVTVADSTGDSVTGFTVNAAAGLVYDVAARTGPLTVSYTVGDGQVPPSVALATLIIAAHLWQTQRGPASSGPLAAASSDDLTTVPGAGYAIPNRARELLQPFMSSAQVA